MNIAWFLTLQFIVDKVDWCYVDKLPVGIVTSLPLLGFWSGLWLTTITQRITDIYYMALLDNAWWQQMHSLATKLRIYNSCAVIGVIRLWNMDFVENRQRRYPVFPYAVTMSYPRCETVQYSLTLQWGREQSCQIYHVYHTSLPFRLHSVFGDIYHLQSVSQAVQH